MTTSVVTMPVVTTSVVTALILGFKNHNMHLRTDHCETQENI